MSETRSSPCIHPFRQKESTVTATLLPTHSISASAHQRISASAHQRISASAHQRISASAHHPITASPHQRISASAHQRNPCHIERKAPCPPSSRSTGQSSKPTRWPPSGSLSPLTSP